MNHQNHSRSRQHTLTLCLAVCFSSLPVLHNIGLATQDLDPGPSDVKEKVSTILDHLESMGMPSLTGSPFDSKKLELTKRRADLIQELMRLQPDHVEVPKYQNERWQLMSNVFLAFVDWTGPLGNDLIQEIRNSPDSKTGVELNQAIADVNEKILVETTAQLKIGGAPTLIEFAQRHRAQALRWKVVNQSRTDLTLVAIKAVELVEKNQGKNADCCRNFSFLADGGFENIDDPNRIRLLKRIVADYPKTNWAITAKGRLRQIDLLGKVFELQFEDAITGQECSLEQFRGKWILLDFWATWCGPCVAKIPTVEKLRKSHEEQLVVIGVNHDRELNPLLDYARENELSWPQFHFEPVRPEFAANLGISSIPIYFLIDPNGKLCAILNSDDFETEVNNRLNTVPEQKPLQRKVDQNTSDIQHETCNQDPGR